MSAGMDKKFHIQTILGGISDTKEVEKAPSHHPAKRIKLVKSFLNQALGLAATPAAQALLCFEDIHLPSVPSPRQERSPSSTGITACTRGFAPSCCAAELGGFIWFFSKSKRQRRVDKSPGAAGSGRSRHGHRSQHPLATEPLHANDRHRLQSCECPSARQEQPRQAKQGSAPHGKWVFTAPRARPGSGERAPAAAVEEQPLRATHGHKGDNPC